MKTRTMGLLAAALCSVGACGKSHRDRPEEQAQPAPPAADAAPALPDSDSIISYMNATIDAVDAAGGDCARLAEPVVALARDNADLLAQMAATRDTHAAKQWISDHIDLFQQFQARLAVVARCTRQSPALVEVLKQLSPPSRPAKQPPATR